LSQGVPIGAARMYHLDASPYPSLLSAVWYRYRGCSVRWDHRRSPPCDTTGPLQECPDRLLCQLVSQPSWNCAAVLPEFASLSIFLDRFGMLSRSGRGSRIAPCIIRVHDLKSNAINKSSLRITSVLLGPPKQRVPLLFPLHARNSPRSPLFTENLHRSWLPAWEECKRGATNKTDSRPGA